jgi:hypothetical protein
MPVKIMFGKPLCMHSDILFFGGFQRITPILDIATATAHFAI